MINFAKNFHNAGIALSGEYFVLECFMSYYVCYLRTCFSNKIHGIPQIMSLLSSFGGVVESNQF